MTRRVNAMRYRLILLTLSALLCVLPRGASAQAAGQSDEQPEPLLEGVIAVIPFFSRSAEPDHQWIGAGIAATVSSDLSRLGLSVLAQGTVSGILTGLGGPAAATDAEDPPLRQAFRERGAAWLVAGAVQHVGPLVRITARIVDVGTGEVVYTVRSDGTSRELFAVQDRIAAAVAEPFIVPPSVPLTPVDEPINPLPVGEPLTTPPLGEPLTTPPLGEPLTTPPLGEPLTTPPLGEPLTSPAVDRR